MDDKKFDREVYLKKLELEDKKAYYDVMKIIGHPGVGGNGGTKADTRFCAHCGKPVPASAAFCPNCGKPVASEKICGKCGQERCWRKVLLGLRKRTEINIKEIRK